MIETAINNDPTNPDLLKAQQDELTKLNTTADRILKQMRRKEAKLKAEAQQKWMVFSNVDAFDEAEIVQLTVFMKTLTKK
jgi:predicted dinucleotide-binding enzyme